MARVYATAAQYETYTGITPAPADIGARLAKASKLLDRSVLRYCGYETDGDGLPTDAIVAQAFADATCAQAEWGIEVGDTTGAAGVGWGEVEVGSVKLKRSLTATSGDDAPGRQVAPAVWDALLDPDLGPARFVMGLVLG
ncbi:hypothetical protein L1085_016360 [Streptomyces sp. MSC1_001]|jgi:hypothetical protein|uniref:hypothetical protein n=1 Tax=Streptomyces sp. MSC1_001 TaxID=2909263 RepID=UPI002030DB6C|nr:hypothetical protein [Streptomyces sp. MSC1_001]